MQNNTIADKCDKVNRIAALTKILEPLVKEKVPVSVMFNLIKHQFGWKALSSLYRALDTCGLKAGIELNTDVVQYGARAAKTLDQLNTEFSIGSLIKHFTVIGRPEHRKAGKDGKLRQWYIPLRCKCGHELTASVCHLRGGKTTSCGCVRAKRYRMQTYKYGGYSNPYLYRLSTSYNAMIQRCNNVNYERYGGRGIKVCAEWKHDKDAFVLWALTHGYSPGMCLDRINNDGDYSPDNCRYVTDIENSNNRSSNTLYTHDGRSQSLSAWCRELGIEARIVQQRVTTYGWTFERAITEPVVAVDYGNYVYLCYRPEDGVLAVGKTSVIGMRERCLGRGDFRFIGRYQCADARNMGFLEILVQQWLDKNGVLRKVAVKTKNSKQGHETFFKHDAVHSGFKFKKLCAELEKTIPDVIADLIQRCAVEVNKRAKSKKNAISAWLNSQGIDHRFDCGAAVISDKNIAVTFSIKTKVIYRNTDRRDEAAELAAYFKTKSIQLLFIDEDAWELRPATVKHWLLHKLGKSERLCSARQCEIKKVEGKDACAFYDMYHLQGRVGGEHFGLYFKDRLVACMTFSKIAPSRGQALEAGKVSLVRFALAGSVPGAASRLFKHACQANDYQEVVTFSDNSYASGNIYDTLGFKLDAELPPDYRVWHPKLGINHKSYWQRSQIPRRLAELHIKDAFDPETDPRTEYDMEKICHCKLVWDCGKKRHIWRKPL